MFICIDIGGTNSRIALFESFENPKIKDSQSFKHTGYYNQDLKNIANAIKKMTSAKIEGIGMSIAGILNKDKSSLAVSSNLPSWMGQPIKDDLYQIFDCPIELENDSAATALGEAMFGLGKDKNFLFMVWGTGIGGSSVANRDGRIRIEPFEPGHFPLEWNGPTCPCGQQGCLEVYCGGAGIKKKYGVSAENLNDAQWNEVIERFMHALMTIIMLRPSPLIIMSGSVAVKQFGRLAKMKNILEEKLKVYDVPALKISKFEEQAGVFGALALLKQNSLVIE